MKKGLLVLMIIIVLSSSTFLSVSSYVYDQWYDDVIGADEFKKSWKEEKDVTFYDEVDKAITGTVYYGFSKFLTDEDYCKFILDQQIERQYYLYNNKGDCNITNWNSFYDGERKEIKHNKATAVRYGVRLRN